MNKLIRVFERWWCQHPRTLHRMAGNRWYTECMDCGHESTGIYTGGMQCA